MNETAIVGENVEVIQTTSGTGRSALSWGVAIAGALAATAITFIFLSLGSGVGLSVASPYSGPSLGALTIAGAIWLVMSQTFGYAAGGYLAGRLRVRTHLPGPETRFRDAAHGFLAWVIGVGLTATIVFVIGAFSASTAANVAGSIGSGAAQGASAAAVSRSAPGSVADNGVGYFVDMLFRTAPGGAGTAQARTGGGATPTPGVTLSTPPSGQNLSTQTPATQAGQTAASPTGETPPSMATAGTRAPAMREGATTGAASEELPRGEVARIMLSGMGEGRLSDSDRAYMGRLVAARTGISPEEAERRVTEVQNQAVAAAKEAADKARKAGAYLSFWSFMALLFGGVAATLGGILGGELRDEV
jgi:hypothetical protein